MTDDASDIVALLREVPLFAEFREEELAGLAARCLTRRYRKGETLWEVGDPAEELLIVAEGELAVWGSGEIVARLDRGDTVGEIALLLHEPRSATTTATRQTRVLVLSQTRFESVVRDDPRASAAISEILSQRMRATFRRSALMHRLVCAVVGEPGQTGTTLVARFVAARLAQDAAEDVLRLIVDHSGVPIRELQHDEAWHARITDGALIARRDLSATDTIAAISALVERASTRYRVIVVEIGAHAGLETASAVEYADVMIELVANLRDDTRDVPHARVLRIRNHNDGSPSRNPDVGPNAFVLPYDGAISTQDPARAADLLLAQRRRPLTRSLDRLVRAIERRVVGVAFGAGAALGLAHIGALLVLEKHGIPIDLVAGSSMGAVVAVGSAAGACATDLESTAHELSSFVRLLRTVDIATTGDGIIAGRQLLKYMRPYLHGAQTFDDLVTPARVVATDLASGERVAIRSGDIETAVHASIAMPPFLTPVMRDGRTLVDGGIIDPVPVDVVREMGADIVIAINAMPPVSAETATVLTRVSRGLNRLNPLAYLNGRLHSLNLLDIVMNAFQVTEYQLGEYLARSADVVVRPNLAAHTWIEFYRAPEIIECGSEATRDAIPQVERVMADRLSHELPLGTPHLATSQ
ncbi:MAG TPA: cyclic nucleotide-binding and patatin-like phospholipase domain-containing protein [Acidimicrobiia bacterium]